LAGAGARASTVQSVNTPSGGDQSGLAADGQDNWAGYAHVGYHIDPHWRIELQGGYHEPGAGPALAPSHCADPLAGAVCAPDDQALGAYSAVANLIFDAAPNSQWVDPFAAVGTGVTRFDPGSELPTNPVVRLLQLNATRAQLAYQAVIGLAFRPHDRLHFDLTYRWLDGAGAGLNGQPVAFNGRYQDQTLAVTMRYALSAPPPAITPSPTFGLVSAGAATQLAPVYAAPRAMVVQTPSNPNALAVEVASAVRQAARTSSEGFGSRIVVNGHADTASAANYNGRLSERRAKAMADAMVALGVPATAVDVRWPGAATKLAAAIEARADTAPSP
jgi:opacity protein-like surface antigen